MLVEWDLEIGRGPWLVLLNLPNLHASLATRAETNRLLITLNHLRNFKRIFVGEGGICTAV